jgi:acetyl esterase/lipase
MDRRTVLGLGAFAVTALAARAETAKRAMTLPADPPETILLWPGTPPGGEGVRLAMSLVDHSPDPAVWRDRFSRGIEAPFLTVFRPDKPDGSAMLVVPGGGYVVTAFDREGYDVARRLNASGVTVFVLRYRLPGEGWKQPSDVPLQDMQRALRLIRAQASRYGVDANRVGVMGFSAGGHMAASLTTRYLEQVYAPVDAADRLDPRPAFSCLMYPVITMTENSHPGSRETLLGKNPSPEQVAKYSCERRVTAGTPPVFLCLAIDDDVVPPMPNGLAMYQALAAAKVPGEIHIFQEGGHGFGIHKAAGKPCEVWPDLFVRWARQGGWIKGEAV